MGPESKERGSGDLWELTIDDLFTSSDAAASELDAAVPGPFAIDLCTSVEPASEIAPSLRDFDQLHVYQVTDWQDDRLVFRLRLGPIDSELEADAILSIVRRDYPAATTLPISDDDQRMIAIVAASRPKIAVSAEVNGTRVGANRVPEAAPAAPTEVSTKARKVEPLVAPPTAAARAPMSAASAPEDSKAFEATAAFEGPIDPDATATSEDSIDFAATFRDLAAELLAPLALPPRRPAAAMAKVEVVAAKQSAQAKFEAPAAKQPLPAKVEVPAAKQPALAKIDAPAAKQPPPAKVDAPAAKQPPPAKVDAPAAKQSLPAKVEPPDAKQSLAARIEASAAKESTPPTAEASAPGEKTPANFDSAAAEVTIPARSEVTSATTPGPVKVEAATATAPAPFKTEMTAAKASESNPLDRIAAPDSAPVAMALATAKDAAPIKLDVVVAKPPAPVEIETATTKDPAPVLTSAIPRKPEAEDISASAHATKLSSTDVALPVLKLDAVARPARGRITSAGSSSLPGVVPSPPAARAGTSPPPSAVDGSPVAPPAEQPQPPRKGSVEPAAAPTDETSTGAMRPAMSPAAAAPQPAPAVAATPVASVPVEAPRVALPRSSRPQSDSTRPASPTMSPAFIATPPAAPTTAPTSAVLPGPVSVVATDMPLSSSLTRAPEQPLRAWNGEGAGIASATPSKREEPARVALPRGPGKAEPARASAHAATDVVTRPDSGIKGKVMPPPPMPASAPALELALVPDESLPAQARGPESAKASTAAAGVADMVLSDIEFELMPDEPRKPLVVEIDVAPVPVPDSQRGATAATERRKDPARASKAPPTASQATPAPSKSAAATGISVAKTPATPPSAAIARPQQSKPHTSPTPAPVAPPKSAKPPPTATPAPAKDSKSAPTVNAVPKAAPAAPAPVRAAATPPKAVSTGGRPPQAANGPPAGPAPTKSAAPAAAVPPEEAGPAIDSTQTLRALVLPERGDGQADKLLVIQLAYSEQEIAPDSVPNLAIFNEYKLYSAVGKDDGKVMHALRLGFFHDEGPAEAVAGYLRSFFEAPKVVRVSVEERERFAKRRVAARKDSETGVHAAIELSSAPTAPSTSLADLAAKTGTAPRAAQGRGRG